MIKASDADSSRTMVIHPHANANGEEDMVNGIDRGYIGGAGPSQFYSSSPMRY